VARPRAQQDAGPGAQVAPAARLGRVQRLEHRAQRLGRLGRHPLAVQRLLQLLRAGAAPAGLDRGSTPRRRLAAWGATPGGERESRTRAAWCSCTVSHPAPVGTCRPWRARAAPTCAVSTAPATASSPVILDPGDTLATAVALPDTRCAPVAVRLTMWGSHCQGTATGQGGARLHAAQHLRLRAVVDQRQAVPVHGLAVPARPAPVLACGDCDQAGD